MLHSSSRRTTLGKYASSTREEWEEYIGTYSKEGIGYDSKLYYLSLDSTLQDTFYMDTTYDDHLANHGDPEAQEVYTVTLPQRLLANTDLQGCWNQAHSKILQCYRMEYDYTKPIQLYLYEVDVSDCLVVDNDVLVSMSHVHNAYVNGTVAVFGVPKLRMVQHHVVENTLNYPDEYCTYYYPFNDGEYTSRLLSTPLKVIATINL